MNKIFPVPNKEKNDQSYLVYVLTIVWTMVSGINISVDFFYFPELWLRWLVLLCISLFIAAFNLTLNHFGHTRKAGWSLTIMLWLYITIPCYSAGGIFAAGILSQMSIILSAGFLLGFRGGLAIGLLTIAADFTLACLQVTGHLPTSLIVHDPISRWISAIIPFGTILILQYYAINQLRSNLIRMESEILKRNVTRKNEVLEEQRTNEERYKSIITVSNTGAWEYNLDTDQIWFSAQYFEMLGIDRDEGTSDAASDTTWVDRLHPDDREQSTKIFDEFLKGASLSLYDNYFRMRHQNGDWVWIWSRARRLRDREGNLTSICLGTHIDISERIKAEEQIKESEQLIKKITSQVPGNTYLFEIEENGKTNIIFCNRGRDSFLQSYDSDHLAADPNMIREIVHDDDKAKFDDAMRAGWLTHSMISFQYRIVINGHISWRWMQAVSEEDKNGKILWYGATSDITPLVDYIISIEQIIFDIAHVIRRPISSMMGMTTLIADHELDGEEIKELSKELYVISEEMDKFIGELNRIYHEKRENTMLNIDISSFIDKRNSLFD